MRRTGSTERHADQAVEGDKHPESALPELRLDCGTEARLSLTVRADVLREAEPDTDQRPTRCWGRELEERRSKLQIHRYDASVLVVRVNGSLNVAVRTQ
jgi:hypothetical protein